MEKQIAVDTVDDAFLFLICFHIPKTNENVYNGSYFYFFSVRELAKRKRKLDNMITKRRYIQHWMYFKKMNGITTQVTFYLTVDIVEVIGRPCCSWRKASHSDKKNKVCSLVSVVSIV